LGIGDWAQNPKPKTQNPIPKNPNFLFLKFKNKNNY